MSLKWTDINSETLTIDGYLKKFIDKVDIKINYENYKPNSKYIKRIKILIKNELLDLKILTIGEKWCHDCTKQIPNMIKIIRQLNSKKIEMRILYGIKINAFRKEGEILWDKRHSVPEAIDPKFNLIAIPTFYIFRDNKLIGRIVELPKRFSSLEKDLYNILK